MFGSAKGIGLPRDRGPPNPRAQESGKHSLSRPFCSTPTLWADSPPVWRACAMSCVEFASHNDTQPGVCGSTGRPNGWSIAMYASAVPSLPSLLEMAGCRPPNSPSFPMGSIRPVFAVPGLLI